MDYVISSCEYRSISEVLTTGTTGSKIDTQAHQSKCPASCSTLIIMHNVVYGLPSHPVKRATHFNSTALRDSLSAARHQLTFTRRIGDAVEDAARRAFPELEPEPERKDIEIWSRSSSNVICDAYIRRS